MFPVHRGGLGKRPWRLPELQGRRGSSVRFEPTFDGDLGGCSPSVVPRGLRSLPIGTFRDQSPRRDVAEAMSCRPHALCRTFDAPSIQPSNSTPTSRLLLSSLEIHRVFPFVVYLPCVHSLNSEESIRTTRCEACRIAVHPRGFSPPRRFAPLDRM
jgi:hypothetical protein